MKTTLRDVQGRLNYLLDWSVLDENTSVQSQRPKPIWRRATRILRCAWAANAPAPFVASTAWTSACWTGPVSPTLNSAYCLARNRVSETKDLTSLTILSDYISPRTVGKLWQPNVLLWSPADENCSWGVFLRFEKFPTVDILLTGCMAPGDSRKARELLRIPLVARAREPTNSAFQLLTTCSAGPASSLSAFRCRSVRWCTLIREWLFDTHGFKNLGH